jgi:hypothetical protein
MIGEKISDTLERRALGQSPRGIYQTSGISLHTLLNKNIVEEMNCKEDELCKSIEGEACCQSYEHPTLVQRD